MVQTAYVAEEWVVHAHSKLKDKKACWVTAVKNLAVVEKKNKDLLLKLTEADRERKNVKATLAKAEMQVEEQCQHLRKAEEQLAIAYEKIEVQKKELEGRKEAIAKVEQAEYDVGVKETEKTLKAQVTEVCRSYYLQVWKEALNFAKVDATLKLRNLEKVFYPLALREVTCSIIERITTAVSFLAS